MVSTLTNDDSNNDYENNITNKKIINQKFKGCIGIEAKYGMILI